MAIDASKTLAKQVLTPTTTKKTEEAKPLDKGNTTKKTEEAKALENNKTSKSTTYTPSAPTKAKNLADISSKDKNKLLSGLETAKILSWWTSDNRKNPKYAIKNAIGEITKEIDKLGDKLKAMGYKDGVDSSITTLKNYYTAALNSVYDNDNQVCKKGEKCKTTFTYKDANGNTKTESSDFMHFALYNWQNANDKGDTGSQSKLGIVLLEKAGLGHGYSIRIDMNVVANKLINFYNAL